MDQNQTVKLEEICRQLREIAEKTETAAGEIRKKFEGVGSEYCAGCLDQVVKEYRALEKRLESTKTAAKG